MEFFARSRRIDRTFHLKIFLLSILIVEWISSRGSFKASKSEVDFLWLSVTTLFPPFLRRDFLSRWQPFEGKGQKGYCRLTSLIRSGKKRNSLYKAFISTCHHRSSCLSSVFSDISAPFFKMAVFPDRPIDWYRSFQRLFVHGVNVDGDNGFWCWPEMSRSVGRSAASESNVKEVAFHMHCVFSSSCHVCGWREEEEEEKRKPQKESLSTQKKDKKVGTTF